MITAQFEDMRIAGHAIVQVATMQHLLSAPAHSAPITTRLNHRLGRKLGRVRNVAFHPTSMIGLRRLLVWRKLCRLQA